MACCVPIPSPCLMETNVQQAFKAEFEQLRQEVIAYYHSSGRAASGRWASTVQVQELPNGFTLVADDYINGRGPGKPPPSAAIEQWIAQKGIAARLGKEISVSSLAFLIARKIARMGWQPKEGQDNLIAQVVTPERIQQLMDKVAPVYLDNLAQQFFDSLKTDLT